MCDCDIHAFPQPMAIAPGLTRLPRQIGTFAEFRTSLLGRIRTQGALGNWRARDEEDFGLLMLEWWAYIADIIAFYNAEHAQDLYLSTARGDAATRKIVGLIGYKPRPAMAAEAVLAAIVDGTGTVEAPIGTCFISDAINDTPPQEFELTAATMLDTLRNSWTLAPIRARAFDRHNLLLDPASRNLAEDAIVVVDVNGTRAALRVASVAPETAIDNETYLRLTVTEPEDIPDLSTTLDKVRLWGFAQNATVKSQSSSQLTLTGLFPQIRDGELVVVEDTGVDAPLAPQVFTVSNVTFGTAQLDSGAASGVEAMGQLGEAVMAGPLAAAEMVTATTSDPNAITSPVTKVTLSGTTAISPSRARLHFGRVRAGLLVSPAKARIDGTDLQGGADIANRHAAPALTGDGELLLMGAADRGERVEGSILVDADSGVTTFVPGGGFTDFTDHLRTPVSVHGNLMHVTRGKTVEETLGSGEGAAQPFQSFTLAKQPLTYLRDPSATGGRRSTLRVWCDGVEWTEIDSLFLAGAQDRVFTVDLDGEGSATVTFGDGAFGAPAPLGNSNISALYRYGAGDPAPGANEIQQIAGPVPKLRRVFNPTAAFGGGAGDLPQDVRWNAPASSATFDRAVSATDFAAIARDFGALAAVAVTQWMPARLRVGVVVTVIFDGEASNQNKAALKEHLAARAAETLAIDVIAATPVTGELRLSFRRAPDASGAKVAAELEVLFNDPFTGLLSPRRTEIGGPVFRSALLGAASTVPGLETVIELTLDGAPAPQRIGLPAHGYFAPNLVLEDVT